MTSSQLDLSLPQDLVKYLSNGPFASKEVIPLLGGGGNYAYRLRLVDEYKGRKTLVLKFGKPHLSGAHWFPFDLIRQVYETEGMRRVRAMLPADAFVNTPEIHLFDTTANVIIMDDAGEDSLTLKALLQSGKRVSPGSFRKLGVGLGTFLASVHGWGTDDAEAREFFEGNKQGRTLSAWATYERLVLTLSGEDAALTILNEPPLNVDRDTLDRVAKVALNTANAVKTESETIVMGDFWPGNILLSLVQKEGEVEVVEIEKVLVVDWELVKPGQRGMDVGQFCGEMWQMKRFFPETEPNVMELTTAFLATYREQSKSAQMDQVARVALTHIGAHLIAWTPRGTWRGQTIRDVVLEGVQALLDGPEGSQEIIENSFVGELCRGTGSHG